ncbi:MAG: lipopolysaccharide kinase InaA family protein [Nitrospirota bacterium]
MTDALWLADAWRPFFARHRLETLDAFLTCCAGRLVSGRGDGLETLCIELADPGGRSRVLFLKRYAGFRGSWRHYVKVRRLRREVAALQWLRAAGLPVPDLLAWGVRRRWGVVTASFFVTAGLEDAGALSPRPAAYSPCEDEDAAPWLTALARTAGQMHRAGFFHGNLYGRNVLFEPQTGRLFLIDFPDCRITPPLLVRPRLAARDLSCLLHDLPSLPAGAEARFLAAYGDERWPHYSPAARRWLAQRLTRRIRRHAAARRIRLRLSGKRAAASAP